MGNIQNAIDAINQAIIRLDLIRKIAALDREEGGLSVSSIDDLVARSMQNLTLAWGCLCSEMEKQGKEASH